VILPFGNDRFPEDSLARPRRSVQGPNQPPGNEIVARYLKAVGDPREVVRDLEARYLGGRVEEKAA
jgi:hypothetical protein